jgi:hypothetical protein
MSDPLPHSAPGFDHLTFENRTLLDLVLERDRLSLEAPERLIPILFKPCRVRVLLVTDGGLDFSLGDFGLRTFVQTLLTMPGAYVRFQITVAHIDNVSDDAVMVGHPGIVRSIKQFKFDDPSHFAPDMYDQVWLFGIETFYSRGNDPNNNPYPSNQLSTAELNVLAQFMDGGGGLFATGDHGALGICLCGSVQRAKSMRLWNDTSGDDMVNEVSMGGPRRNDTNRLGHDTSSQFEDQSDDVPQTIQPRMYVRWSAIWKYSYPHPLLCGPNGVIRVLPDHPHEGECIEPASPSLAEFPAGTGGLPRPLPQVIATSSVLAGTTSSSKLATQAQSFGAICAYDGHSAGVGRVVTDATWHHFVNVNLVGDSTMPPGDPKRFGFLVSPAGQVHLNNIKSYYRNIAVWISRPSNLSCMRNRLLWELIWHHRVLEAVMTRPDISIARADVGLLYEIGKHARDVLGRYAGQCQSRRLAIDILTPFLAVDLVIRLDPWWEMEEKELAADLVPWYDPEPVLDTALGGALLALREEFLHPRADDVERAEKMLDSVVYRGVQTALDLSMRSMQASSDRFVSTFTRNVRLEPVATETRIQADAGKRGRTPPREDPPRGGNPRGKKK